MPIPRWFEDPRADRGIHLADQSAEWTFWPYTELVTDCYRVATLLRERDVPAGGVIPLLLAEPRDFIAGFLGTLLAGATPAPIASPLTFRGREAYIDHVARIFEVAEPAAVLADGTLADTAAAAAAAAATAGMLPGSAVPLRFSWDALPDPQEAARRAPAETALLQFTSGSSGQPKGVQVSGANLTSNIGAIHRWLRWAAEDATASWLPLYHDMGLIGGLLATLHAEADLWQLTPEQFLRSPLSWLECLGRHGATISVAPNFGYAYTARRLTPDDLAELDFSAWRVAILGAERIDPVALAGFTALAQPRGFDPRSLAPAYGLAESTLAVTGSPPGSDSRIVQLKEGGLGTGEPVVVAGTGRLGTDRPDARGWLTGCGTPVDGLQVHIVDEDGRRLPEGHFGEISVTGSSVAQGYRGDPAASASSFTADGLRTGDTGFLLDGELFVAGRAGDSLKVRGRKVHAEDVETRIADVTGRSPDRAVVVFGSVDGADLAVVVIEASATGTDPLADVVALVRGMTGESVGISVFAAERGSIPRTSSGKPRRRVVWRDLLDGRRPGELVYSSRKGEFPDDRR